MTIRITCNSVEEAVLLLEALKKPKAEPVAEEPVKPEKESVSIQAAEAKPAKDFKLEDIQSAIASLIQNGKQTKAKEILNNFGAAKVSALKAKDYPAVMEAIKNAA